MQTLAPHLDQLEAADRLRDHVFTLVRAGEMTAALILIRADVHAAAAALAVAAEANARVLASEPPVAPSNPEAEDESEKDENEGGQADEGAVDDGQESGGGGAEQEPEGMGKVLQMHAG